MYLRLGGGYFTVFISRRYSLKETKAVFLDRAPSRRGPLRGRVGLDGRSCGNCRPALTIFQSQGNVDLGVSSQESNALVGIEVLARDHRGQYEKDILVTRLESACSESLSSTRDVVWCRVQRVAAKNFELKLFLV